MITVYISERRAELEMTVESLQTELREHEDEANAIIRQWKDKCEAAELKYTSIEQELNDLKMLSGDIGKDQAHYSTVVETLAQKEEELRQTHEEAESSKASLQKLKGMLYDPYYRHCFILFDLTPPQI